MARLARLLARLLPPAFRARYGDELAATLDEAPVGPAVAADLTLSVAREWVRAARPSAGPLEARRRRAVATAFGAGVAGLVSLLVFARAVDDRPVPGLTGWALHLFGAGSVLAVAMGAAAGTFALPFWARVLVSGVRRRDRAALVAAVRPGAVAAGWLAAGALLGRVAGRIGLVHAVAIGGAAGRLHSLGVARYGVLVAFGALTVVAAAWCAHDVRRAFAATPWGAGELLAALAVARLSALVGDALVLIAVVITVRVMLVGGTGAWSGALAIASLAALAVAAAVATVSTLSRPRPAPAP